MNNDWLLKFVNLVELCGTMVTRESHPGGEVIIYSVDSHEQPLEEELLRVDYDTAGYPMSVEVAGSGDAWQWQEE
ncbi:MAG: hypothetical protein ACXABY_24720 [Candidatus Thorarchaeota archaeon]|jgi:hypothetical protein